MSLSDMQKQKISQHIPIFQNYLGASDRDADIKDRQDRIMLYEKLLSPTGLEEMDVLNFSKIIDTLWSYAMWGNKSYLINSTLLVDNKFEDLKRKLKTLLWGDELLALRFDEFRQTTKHFGPATISELLAFTHPGECGLWNKRARNALKLLGFADSFPYLKAYSINGEQYVSFNALLKEIGEFLEFSGIGDLDLLGIDYFLFEVQKEVPEIQEVVDVVIGSDVRDHLSDFDHDDAIDQLLIIGQWLGFEVEKEKKIATDCQVDVVWQAGVANLGVVTYVFEVQRRGSRDGLLINLMSAQNNPTVQRLIIVGLEDELQHIQKMVVNLPENFRRVVGYLDVEELYRASDLVTELSEIINKLELVKSEFGGLMGE